MTRVKVLQAKQPKANQYLMPGRCKSGDKFEALTNPSATTSLKANNQGKMPDDSAALDTTKDI